MLRERDAELVELDRVVDALEAGHGRLVVVEGSAGVGKSALVAAVVERSGRRGPRTLRARGGELEREFAFGAVRQLFEPVVAAAGPVELRRLLAGAAAPARWVLMPEADEPGERTGGGFAALRAIYWLACNLAEAGPLLLVLDDAHWADPSSLRAISFLARRISDVPIALVVALREDEPGAPTEQLDSLREDPDALRIALRPLSPRSSAELVRERLPAAGDDVCSAFHVSTAGNPLYLRQLLLATAGEHLLSRADPAAAVREASLPSLGDRVGRRISGVGPAAPGLAKAMAVLGDGSRLSSAAQLAGIDEAEAGAFAAKLRRLEVLALEDPFQFVHPLVRRSIYDALSVTEREVMHADAAGVLRASAAPAEAVAAQLQLVEPRGIPQVAATLIEAAADALARAAPDEALRWLRRALRENAPEPPRGVILAQLGSAEVALRDPSAIADLEEALTLAGDSRLRARISVTLTEILMNAGQWKMGRAVIDAAAREHRHSEASVAIEIAAMRAVWMAYDREQVEQFDRERPRFAAQAAADGWAAHALAALLAAVAANRGEGDAVVMRLVERALEQGRLLGERAAGGWASAQVLGALLGIDAYERALEVIELVDAAASKSGSLTGLMTALGFRGWIAARKGDLSAAEAELRTALAIVVDAGMPMMAVSGIFFLADAILERPSLDDIAAMIEAMELEPAFLDTLSGAFLLEVRGRLRIGRREFESGTEDLRASGRINADMRIAPSLSPWRSALALALPTEQHDEAVSLAAEELDQARATGLARPTAVALRALGVLEAGDAGEQQLRASVSLLEDSSARLELARSLVELGAALRRRHRRAEARERLTRGIELALSCGAQRLAVRARAELRVAGGRPRRLEASGPAAFTASELRVARLAAEGRTNPEIAQELYITLKTVETHLSHVYGKIGVTGQGSRAQLAAALIGDEGDALKAAR